MAWNILLFETARGDKPVEDFIKPLSSSSRSKVIHMIRLLKQFGTFLNMPHSKKITKDIYELRVKGKEEIRIFYAPFGRKIYLLHAFKKKSQKIQSKEIKLAEQRLKALDKI